MKRRRLGTDDVALACGDLLGETPFWCAGERALYWVDLRQPSLNRLTPATGDHKIWPMPDLCTGAVPADDGSIIVALRHTIARFDPSTGDLVHLAGIEPEALGNRLNETRCDRAGRLWIGSMRDYGAAVSGSLYVVGPDLVAQRMLCDIRIPNALGFSPDDAILYFADTSETSIRRYRFDLASGTLGTPLPPFGGDVAGGPDGSAVDAEGCIWSTRYGAGLLVRFSPEGHVLETVEMPVSQPTACAFGDADLGTLYITTARQRLSLEDLRQQPLAGHLFRLRTDVPGLPEPAFRFGSPQPS